MPEKYYSLVWYILIMDINNTNNITWNIALMSNFLLIIIFFAHFVDASCLPLTFTCTCSARWSNELLSDIKKKLLSEHKFVQTSIHTNTDNI